MKKTHFFNRLVLSLTIFSVSILFPVHPASNAQTSRPQPDCCFLIWSTARYLGWSTALFFNTQVRERWVEYDRIMVEQLQGAIQSVQGVERSCSEARWDDCQQKVLFLEQLMRSFQRQPTSANRRSIYHAVLNTYEWGDQLRRQVYHYRGQTYYTAFATCGEKYYALGFSLATAAQLFRHANEHARYQGTNRWYYRNISSAQRWLKEAQAILGAYQQVRTGRCVPLPLQDYYRIITNILNSKSNLQNLQAWIQDLERVMDDSGQRLRTQCLPRTRQASEEAEARESYQGIEFEQGKQAFADRVMLFRTGEGTAGEFKDPRNALGVPGKHRRASGRNTSLGHGGILVLSFDHVWLVDGPGHDLYVFERGPQVEPFRVEISADGRSWIDLGVVRGQPKMLDIAGKGPPRQGYRYVRITDTGSRMSPHPYAGADIDAVGAINAVRR